MCEVGSLRRHSLDSYYCVNITVVKRKGECEHCKVMMSLQATSKKRGHQASSSPCSYAEWILLVVPWISIVVVACLAAVYYTATEADDDAGTGGAIHRDMLVQDYSHPHEHKQVFKEEHAPLFPLTTSDYYGFFFAVAGLMVAAGGGIGGGGILVPIYILIFGFSPKHAIPLSNITVFGGACANVLLNTPKRHPLVDRPLVDWDLILVMEPLTIAGALMGAFLNKVLPELLLTFMLVVLLSFTAYTTLKKARRMYQAETVAKKQFAANRRESELTAMAQQEDTDQDEEATDKLLDNVEEPEQGEEEHQDGGEKPKEVEKPKKEEPPEVVQRREELEQILEDERHTPSANLSILVTMFVVVLTINLLKGGGAFPSPLGIRCGSTGFWIANAIMLAWILTISAFVRQYLLRKYEAKARCGFSYVEGDIQWDARATVVYPVVCCAAGFFAGMFGVGT